MTRTWKCTVAGTINLISGTFFLIGGITILGLLGQPLATSWAGYAAYSMGLGGIPGSLFVTAFIFIPATALIILGVVSILGGIFSIKRSVWGLALAGSISTFLSLIFLGIPAITLIALSKREFEPQRFV